MCCMLRLCRFSAGGFTSGFSARSSSPWEMDEDGVGFEFSVAGVQHLQLLGGNLQEISGVYSVGEKETKRRWGGRSRSCSYIWSFLVGSKWKAGKEWARVDWLWSGSVSRAGAFDSAGSHTFSDQLAFARWPSAESSVIEGATVAWFGQPEVQSIRAGFAISEILIYRVWPGFAVVPCILKCWRLGTFSIGRS